MFGRVLTICAALIWPLAGLAQQFEDVSAEYAAAFAEYYPSGEAGQVSALTQGLEIVPQIEGHWMFMHNLFRDGQFNEEQLALTCEVVSYDIVPTGRFGFTLTQMSRGEPTNEVATYAFVSASVFSRTTDLDGVIEQIFGDRDIDDMDPDMWAPALSQPMTHGHATVRMPSDNILVIQPVLSPPQILARCP